MPDPIPSCFRGGAAAAPPATAAAGPSVTTSIYETHLGLAALTWSRTVLGLSLRVDLRLAASAASPSPSHGANSASDAASVSSSGAGSAECADASFRFRLRPWLFWKRRGSRRFQLKEQSSSHNHHPQHRVVEFAWDLTRSRFPPGGGPEPCAGFFVAIAVDREMFLVVGDMEVDAYKKTKARNPFPSNASKKGTPENPILISRREHVVLPISGRPYTTRARLGGKEREISIDLGGSGGEREARMVVGLDGKRVIQVKRLRWKFRGNEKVEVDGGARIQVSWDVHNWLFDREPDPSAPAAAPAPAASSDLGHAVFVFRVDRDDTDERPSRRQHHPGKHRSGIIQGGGNLWGLYGLGNFPSSDRSSSSIGVGPAGAAPKGIGKKKKSLLKTSSSSSSSSASSGSSSSVTEWASAEESELQGSGGFSLLIYMWKS